MCSLRRRALNTVRRLIKSKPVKIALYSVLLIGCQKHTVVSRNYDDPTNAGKLAPSMPPSIIKTIAPASPGNYSASLMNFLAFIPEEKVASASEALVDIFEESSLSDGTYENFAHSSLLDDGKKKQFINFVTEHSLHIFEEQFSGLLKSKLKVHDIKCRLSFKKVDSEKMKSAIQEDYFLGGYSDAPHWEALPHMIPNFKSGDYEITKLKQSPYVFQWSAICSSKSDVVAQLLSGHYLVELSTYSLESKFEDIQPYFVQSIDKLKTSPFDQLQVNSGINKAFTVQEILPHFKSFFLSYSR